MRSPGFAGVSLKPAEAAAADYLAPSARLLNAAIHKDNSQQDWGSNIGITGGLAIIAAIFESATVIVLCTCGDHNRHNHHSQQSRG